MVVDLVKQLKEHISNTPKEVRIKEWEDICKFIPMDDGPIFETLESEDKKFENMFNRWYFDDTMKEMAKEVFYQRESSDEVFIESLMRFSDYVREKAYGEGVNEAERAYQEED